MTPLKFYHIHSQRKYDAMMAALAEAPCSREELSVKMHCSSSVAVVILRKARDAKQVRIAMYFRTPGKFSPVYALGSEPDAVLPTRLTDAERRVRLAADKPRNAERNRKIAECQRRKRAIKFPQLHAEMLEAVRHLRSGSTPDIAKIVGHSVNRAFCYLRELEAEQKVVRVSKKKVRPIRWALHAEGLAPDELAGQAVVLEWEQPKVQPQGIFAALGL